MEDVSVSGYGFTRGKIPGAAWVGLLLVFLTVMLLSQFTPMVSDDFAYCFSWSDWTRIHSVSQIFPSMAVHRNVTNGRVFVHGIVQLLLMFPRPVYSVLNALNAVLLLYIIHRLLHLQDWKKEFPLLLSAAFYIWCII